MLTIRTSQLASRLGSSRTFVLAGINEISSLILLLKTEKKSVRSFK